MLARSCVAGPGPRTLALALRFASGNSRRSPRHQPPNPRPSVNAQTSRGAEPPIPPVSNDIPIFLPPPPLGRESQPDFIRLRESIADSKGKPAIRAWSKLVDQQSTHLATEDDWRAISDLLLGLMTGNRSWNLSYIARKEPATFGLIMNMGVESAARDHWNGLHAILLRLLREERPLDIVGVFDKYKTRKREVEGKILEHLDSSSREKRVAARLSGDGLSSLSMVYITALTMLDLFDAPTILGILETEFHVDERRFDEQLYPVRRNLPKATAKSVIDRVKGNLYKHRLAIECYHPDAMERRIKSAVTMGNFAFIKRKYQQMLQASIGPERFIYPRSLDEVDGYESRYDSIPLSPDTWYAFLFAFRNSGDVDAITRMVDIEMPARSLKPNAKTLSTAMVALVMIKNDPRMSDHTKKLAGSECERYYATAITMGLQHSDEVLSARIAVLGFDKRYQDVHAMFKEAKLGLNGWTKVGKLTADAFMSFFLRTSRPNHALEVLSLMLDPTSDRFPYPTKIIYQHFLKWNVSGPYSAKQRSAAVRLLLKTKPADIAFSSASFGYLICHYIEIYSDIDIWVDQIINNFLHSGERNGTAGIQAWSTMIHSILTQNRAQHNTSQRGLRACLRVLSHMVEHPESVVNVNMTKVKTTWEFFLTHTARSSQISSDMRTDLIRESLRLFEIGFGEPTLRMYTTLIECGLSRPDGQGVREAWHWWEELVSKMSLGGRFWLMMYNGLVQQDAWALVPDLIQMARDQGIEEHGPFWEMAHKYEAGGASIDKTAVAEKVKEVELDEEMEDDEDAFTGGRAEALDSEASDIDLEDYNEVDSDQNV